VRFKADTLEINKPGDTLQFVALADLVKAELTKIADAFNSFVAGTGGASFGSPYTSASDVAAKHLKASQP
jgi:hypothetical protein